MDDQFTSVTETSGTAFESLLGCLLQTLAISKPAGRFLQLGATNGTRTAWLLSGMDDSSELVCVDTDADAQRVAKQSLGLDGRVSFSLSEATAFLKSQHAASTDLAFIQAAPSTLRDVEDAVNVVKIGGFCIFDEPLLAQTRSESSNLIAQASNHPGLRLLPLQWSQSCVVAVRRL